jgi:hypothetical protein
VLAVVNIFYTRLIDGELVVQNYIITTTQKVIYSDYFVEDWVKSVALIIYCISYFIVFINFVLAFSSDFLNLE